MKRAKRGFTLVELMLGILIASMVIMLGMQLLGSSFKGFTLTSKEYSVQNGVRASMDNIANTAKEATAVFTVGKDKFDPADLTKMTRGWSYIALNEDGTKLLNHIWVWTDKKAGAGKHKTVDITPSEWNLKSQEKNVEYSIGFYRKNDGTPLSEDEENELRQKKVIRVSLSGKSADRTDTYSLERDILGENLNQVLDSRASRLSPITALAYKTDYLEDPVKKTAPAEAAVVFVVDISSSMMRNLQGDDFVKGPDGKPQYGVRIPVEQQRITILKKTTGTFIEELEKSGAIDLYFVPFATNLFGEINNDINREINTDPNVEVKPVPIEKNYFQLMDFANGYIDDITKTPITRWEIFQANAWGRSGVQIADKILALFEGVTWPDPDIQAEFERIKQDIESDKQKVQTVLPSASNPWAFGDHDGPTLIPVTRDLYMHCIQLLKLPFPLNHKKAQAQKAKDYVDAYLNASTDPNENGQTNVGGAIREAFKMLEKSSKKHKYLVVLTDGNPTHFDFLGNLHQFQVFEESNEGSQAGDTSHGETPKDHIKLSDSPNYEDVGAGNGDSVLLGSDAFGPVYGYVGPGKGQYINRQYQKVPDGTGTHFFYTYVDVVSPGQSKYPTKAPKPGPGQSLAIERFRRADGIRNYTIKDNPNVLKGTHYIKEVTSSSYGYNVRQPDGSPFINQTFLISFTGVDAEKTMMRDYMKGYFDAGGGTDKTTYLDATSEVSLSDVFTKVVDAIQKELWYFEGP